MSDHDIVAMDGENFTRKILHDKWARAGKPPVNSAGRLYGEQKMLFDRWRAGWAGYYPADNPDSDQPLAHVRFAALDIDPTPERVARLSAEGLVRPYSYEPWHWELPNVRQYEKVTEIPAAAVAAAQAFNAPPSINIQKIKELIMSAEPIYVNAINGSRTILWLDLEAPFNIRTEEEAVAASKVFKAVDVANEHELNVTKNLFAGLRDEYVKAQRNLAGAPGPVVSPAPKG